VVELDILKRAGMPLLAEPTLVLKVVLAQRLEVIPVRVPVGMWVEVMLVEAVMKPV
jgi:hypothetical protein